MFPKPPGYGLIRQDILREIFFELVSLGNKNALNILQYKNCLHNTLIKRSLKLRAKSII